MQAPTKRIEKYRHSTWLPAPPPPPAPVGTTGRVQFDGNGDRTPAVYSVVNLLGYSFQTVGPRAPPVGPTPAGPWSRRGRRRRGWCGTRRRPSRGRAAPSPRPLRPCPRGLGACWRRGGGVQEPSQLCVCRGKQKAERAATQSGVHGSFEPCQAPIVVPSRCAPGAVSMPLTIQIFQRPWILD